MLMAFNFSSKWRDLQVMAKYYMSHWRYCEIVASAQALYENRLFSLRLLFELVFPESTSERSRPHMQGRPGGERQEEEEGHWKTEPVHYTSSQSAKRQLSQHLQCRQETVVCRLQGRRKVEWLWRYQIGKMTGRKKRFGKERQTL